MPQLVVLIIRAVSGLGKVAMNQFFRALSVRIGVSITTPQAFISWVKSLSVSDWVLIASVIDLLADFADSVIFQEIQSLYESVFGTRHDSHLGKRIHQLIDTDGARESYSVTDEELAQNKALRRLIGALGSVDNLALLRKLVKLNDQEFGNTIAPHLPRGGMSNEC